MTAQAMGNGNELSSGVFFANKLLKYEGWSNNSYSRMRGVAARG